MINQTDENLLNGYIAGTLNPDELELLRARMEKNDEMRQKMKLIDSLDAPLNDWQSLQLRKKLFDIYQSDEKRPIGLWGFTTTKWQRLSVVAALVVVMVGISLTLFSPGKDSGDLYSDYYQPAKPFLMQRSVHAADLTGFGEAMQYYSKADYVNAARLLASQTDNMAARFYLAVSMMELNDFSKAIGQFEVVAADQSNLFTDQAVWYLALCYIKTGNEPQAIRVLESSSSSQSYFNDKAVELLAQLR